MAQAIETRRVKMGNTWLLYKKTKGGVYAKGLFLQEKFTQREGEVMLTQPSEEVLQELIGNKHHSEASLAYIRQAWREAEVKDHRFKL